MRTLKDLTFKLQSLHWRLRAARRPHCRLCNGETIPREAYGRIFLQCQECQFVFSGDYPEILANLGMGMVGSWNGPEAGGEREDFLVRMLYKDLGKKTFLLYGVGSAVVFPTLLSEGFDTYGCDVSKSVVRYRQRRFGPRFFHARALERETHRFDVVVACEVFEHFLQPKIWISRIVTNMARDGILCGTTNFHPGGEIEDGSQPGYMSHRCHVAYWSDSAMSQFFRRYQMGLVTFEMICPGSLKPDPKYQQLFPNKRVFFLSRDASALDHLRAVRARSPILPIDTSAYPHPAYSKHRADAS